MSFLRRKDARISQSTAHAPKRGAVLPIAMALVIGTLPFAAVTAGAAGPEAKGAQAVSTVVILDVSGSMVAEDAPGSRIEAAKAAVKNVVENLPSGAQVGLEVYGTGTGSSGEEKEAGCQDVKMLIPVASVDKASFVSTVDGIVASGYTPIGLALQTAADALPKGTPGAIVLVSDGIDTCSPPPPCDVAKELVA